MDPSSSSTLDDDPPHVIGGDLRIPIQQTLLNDNPTLYYYWVHLTELERDKSHEKGKATTKITEGDKKLVGSLIEVHCGMMRWVHTSDFLGASGLLLSLAGTVSHSPSQFFAGLFATVWIAMLLLHHHGL